MTIKRTAKKSAAKKSSAKKGPAKTAKKVSQSALSPEAAIRVLEGDLTDGRDLKVSLHAVDAWAMTTHHNLRRIMGDSAPHVQKFKDTIDAALGKAKVAKSFEVDAVLKDAVKLACALIKPYLRTLYDENGTPLANRRAL